MRNILRALRLCDAVTALLPLSPLLAHLFSLSLCPSFLAPQHHVDHKLVEAGASVAARDRDGRTAAHHYCALGEDDGAGGYFARHGLSELLAKHGAPANALDRAGRSLLMAALGAPKPSLLIVGLLLDGGADPNLLTAARESCMARAGSRTTKLHKVVVAAVVVVVVVLP